MTERHAPGYADVCRIGCGSEPATGICFSILQAPAKPGAAGEYRDRGGNTL